MLLCAPKSIYSHTNSHNKQHASRLPTATPYCYLLPAAPATSICVSKNIHSHTSHHILSQAYVLAKTLNSTPATTSNRMLLGYPTTASASRTTATCFLHQLPHPTTCFGVSSFGQQQAEPLSRDDDTHCVRHLVKKQLPDVVADNKHQNPH